MIQIGLAPSAFPEHTVRTIDANDVGEDLRTALTETVATTADGVGGSSLISMPNSQPTHWPIPQLTPCLTQGGAGQGGGGADVVVLGDCVVQTDVEPWTHWAQERVEEEDLRRILKIGSEQIARSAPLSRTAVSAAEAQEEEYVDIVLSQVCCSRSRAWEV